MTPGACSGLRPRRRSALLLGASSLLVSPAVVSARRMLVRGVTISPEEGGGATRQPPADSFTLNLSAQSAPANGTGFPAGSLAAAGPQLAAARNGSALGATVNGTALLAENVSAQSAWANGTALVAESASALGAALNGTSLLDANLSAPSAPANGTALVAENVSAQSVPANGTAVPPVAAAAAPPPLQDREISSDGCFIRGGDLVGCAVNPTCTCGWSRHCYPRPLRPGEAPLPGFAIGGSALEDVGACGPSMAALSLLSMLAFTFLLLGTVSLRIWLQWKEAAAEAVMAVSAPPPVQIT